MLSHVSPGWLDYKWFSFSSIYHSTVSHFLQWICITFIIKKCGCCLIQSDRKSKLVAQLGLTLFDPVDCSPPGFSVCGILQARILEWVAIPSSRGSSPTRDWTWVSCIAGGFFTVWSTREAPLECLPHAILFKGLFAQLPYFIFTTTLYISTMIISTLDMSELKHREGKEFAWDHTTSQLWKLK